jgi:hypothetical protein
MFHFHISRADTANGKLTDDEERGNGVQPGTATCPRSSSFGRAPCWAGAFCSVRISTGFGGSYGAAFLEGCLYGLTNVSAVLFEQFQYLSGVLCVLASRKRVRSSDFFPADFD